MSHSSQRPNTIESRPESVYVSIRPTNAIAEAAKPHKSKVLNEEEPRYAWNKRPEENNRNSIALDTVVAPPQYPTAVEPFDQPVGRRELADMRAQFAEESEQNVALLKPTTVDDLHHSLEETDSNIADSVESVVPSLSTPEKPESTQIWGIEYHAVDMEQALDYLEQVIKARRPSFAVTSNLNYAMLCDRNPRLAAFTHNSALTLCDGMPILWRSKLNAIKLPERVAGSDLIYRLTERCANEKLRVYFYGASQGVAEAAAAVLKNLYPKLKVAGVQCPPFRACSTEEIRSQIARIKQTRPDLLFVALGQPKGEYWIEDHLEELGVPLTIQVGASFDFVAGNATRAPKLLQKIGLEWLYRTFKDPVRLAPRYFNNLVFLAKALRRELIEKLS